MPVFRIAILKKTTQRTEFDIEADDAKQALTKMEKMYDEGLQLDGEVKTDITPHVVAKVD